MSGSMGPDDGFERLLRGETPKTPEEQALGLFLQDVRGAFPAEPSLAEEAHLAAIVHSAQLLATKGEPAVRSASTADGRARHASGRPERRRVIVKVPLMRSLAAKVVAGLVVLMSMFGGLALAGALPGQGSHDDANDVVEVQDVSDEAPETEAPDTEAPETEAPDTEAADDQGENADDQGENEAADDQGNDDQGENEDADDQGENENADDQGNDDQGENENADDQGENADQGEQD
jgi:hypothetical protein